MLRYRLLMATLIIAPLVGLLLADYHWGPPGAWLAPLALLAVVAAVGEMLGLLEAGGLQPVKWTCYGGAVLVLAASLAPLCWTVRGASYPADCPLGQLGWPWAAMGLSVGLVFLGEMIRYQAPGGVIVHVATALLTVAYTGLLFSFLVALRMLDSNETGMAALVSVIWVAKWSDTGAYAFGRLFGKRKLVPLLSPGKTIVGGLGGLATGAAAAFVFFQWITPWLTLGRSIGHWWMWIGFGLLVTLAAMVGDLAASLLKRDMGRKDSSTWMPGLGGVLDVIDSVILSSPVGYLCWTIML